MRGNITTGYRSQHSHIFCPGEEALVISDPIDIVSTVGAFKARDIDIHINHLDCPILLHYGEVEDSSCR